MRFITRYFAAVFIAALPFTSFAEDMMPFDDFTNAPESRWSYVADRVMGGVSDGQVAFGEEEGVAFITLTGNVSTDNNGGFIQVRRQIEGGFPADTQGLSVKARGNGETYYVFLRSRKGTRPWHSYRATFVAGDAWGETRMKLADFEPSRDDLPAQITPDDVTGIGLVAYGKDFEADVAVAEIRLF